MRRITLLNRITFSRGKFELSQRKDGPTLKIITHRRGLQESVTTEVSRNLPAEIKGLYYSSKITAPRGETSYPTHFSELELRPRPASILQATQRDSVPKLFQEASHEIDSDHWDLLNIRHRVAEVGSRFFQV